MSGNKKREYGDYQTPMSFCEQVCDYLLSSGIVSTPNAVLEPTCGIGNFLRASANRFPDSRFFGVEINEQYANEAKRSVPAANIIHGDIFDFDTHALCQEDDILVIGNPPWATNSELRVNLPPKSNFKGLRGIEALTGASNFDICEYIILQLINRHKNTNSVICMLCKTSVARNIVLEISRNHIPHKKIQMLLFSSSKVFGIAATACVFVLKLDSHPTCKLCVECEVMDFNSLETIDTLVVSNGTLRSSSVSADLEGQSQMTWRQGVKHDCGKVMELELKDDVLINKHHLSVGIEPDLVFPLVKSSHFKRPIITDFSKYVIVTQRKPRQDTSFIQQKLPKTWDYLQNYRSQFDGRKSSIYSNAPAFSMFGVGDYTFSPYKVGVSGFYKKPLFSLLHSEKPVMTDDTAYFLPFDDYDTAYCMMLLLNSDAVQQFLMSIAFLDSKRPYTVKLLSKLDFRKCLDAVSFERMQQTEQALSLDSYLTSEHYDRFSAFIRSLP